MQQTKAHKHTNSISSVLLERYSNDSETDREKEEKGRVAQRCKNTSVYLLLAGRGCHDEDRTKHTWTTYGDSDKKTTQNDIKGKRLKEKNQRPSSESLLLS